MINWMGEFLNGLGSVRPLVVRLGKIYIILKDLIRSNNQGHKSLKKFKILQVGVEPTTFASLDEDHINEVAPKNIRTTR